jgi:ubiquitin-conjugating enzyme E2 Q
MENPFPIGMGLRVPHPSQAAPATSNTPTTTVTGSYAQQYQYFASGQQTTTLEPKLIEVDEDGLCEFDQMDGVQVTLACFSLYDARPFFRVDEGVYRQAHR